MISIYECGFLTRIPLGTSYVSVATYLRGLLARLPSGTEVIVDQTGVGQGVADIFQACGVAPIGVTITAGDQVNREDRAFRVPKLDLISCVQALLDQRLLKIRRDLPEADVLVREMQDYVVQYTALGSMTFNARSSKHDDTILALALACWRAAGGGMRYRGLFDVLAQDLGPPAPVYFIGVDLGKVNDFTAIAVVKRMPATTVAEATSPEPGALYEPPAPPQFDNEFVLQPSATAPNGPFNPPQEFTTPTRARGGGTRWLVRGG